MHHTSSICRPHGLAFFAAIALISPMLSAAPAEPDLGATLCDALKQLLPEVKTYKPEAARAQLVMVIGDKFNYNAAKLAQVRTDIDTATSRSCPNERKEMLDAVKMKTLSEAVG